MDTGSKSGCGEVLPESGLLIPKVDEWPAIIATPPGGPWPLDSPVDGKRPKFAFCCNQASAGDRKPPALTCWPAGNDCRMAGETGPGVYERRELDGVGEWSPETGDGRKEEEAEEFS